MTIISHCLQKSTTFINEFREKYQFRLTLESLSLLYLTLPWFIFVWGWTKSSIALVVTLTLMGSLFYSNLMHKEGIEKNRKKITQSEWFQIGLILVVALIWTRLSGAGGYGLQNWDWVKSNAVLKDLVFRGWPVGFSSMDGFPYSMIYYIAYYLPAALIGKIWGWTSANHMLFLYSLFGVVLSLLWFCRLVGRQTILVAVLFVFAGGLDFFADIFLWGTVHGGVNNMQRWTNIWEIQGNSFVLFWGPQHAIGAWIITAMIVSEAMYKKSIRWLGFLMSVGILWSPLVLIGILPFGLLSIYEAKGRDFFSFHNWVSAPLLFILGFLFFTSHSFNMPRGWIWRIFNIFDVWHISSYLLTCLSLVYLPFFAVIET